MSASATTRRSKLGLGLALAMLLLAPASASAATVSQHPQGSWVGSFGADGYALGGWNAGTSDLVALPDASVSLVQGRRWLWKADAGSDARALEAPDKTKREAATWFDNRQLRLRLDFSAAYRGNLHLYAVDWSSHARRERITVAGETITLDRDFHDGLWITVPIDVASGGSLTINIDRLAGDNAVLSGLFLGGQPPAVVTQSPQGNWVDSFGAAGYALGGWNGGTSDLLDLPDASLTLVQGRRWLWAADAGSDVRALQAPDKSKREAAAWYDDRRLRLRLDFSAAFHGNLHLYAVDWSSHARRQRLTVAGQTIELDDDFNEGAWITLPIDVANGGSLPITIERLAGHNAVLSGIFLGERRDGPPQPLSTTITTTPALSPSFDPAVSDYAVRCDGSTPAQVTTQSDAGTTTSIDGQPAKSGTNTASVGLKGGQGFNVLAATTAEQKRYFIRCLPSDFPAYTFTRQGTPSQQWYIVTPSLSGNGRPYVAMFSAHGVPVWWYKDARAPLDAKLLANGNLVWSHNFGGGYVADTSNTYDERRFDGSLVRSIKAPGGVPTDSHDLAIQPNGNIITVAYVERSTTVDLSPWGAPSDAYVLDALIQEQDPSGNLLWSWNSKDHIALGESQRWLPGPSAVLPNGHRVYDIVHINAAVPVPGGLLISLRHTDAVYKIDKSTGDVVWKLGGTATPERLAVNGDPLNYPLGGQHDPQRLSDGTVSIFDNGTNLARAPRAVRYSINEAAKTATFLEQQTNSAVAPSSSCCGSSRKVGSGGWLVHWGGGPASEEFAANGSKVFSLTFSPSNLFLYRTVGVPPGQVTVQQLRDGMNTQYPRP